MIIAEFCRGSLEIKLNLFKLDALMILLITFIASSRVLNNPWCILYEMHLAYYDE